MTPLPRDKIVLVLTLVVATALAWSAGDTGDLPRSEHQAKAAYVYSFAKFVEWPAGAFDNSTAPIRVAILGDDRLGVELDRMVTGRSAQGRPLEVYLVGPDDRLDSYHIISLSIEDPVQAKRLVANLAEQPALTIGDEGPEGVIIRFERRDNSVKFALDVTAAERAGIRLSSRLIGLAERVVR